ncbi:MAG: hypothetical protein AAB649_01680 [Patescibacteria group bacterium]
MKNTSENSAPPGPSQFGHETTRDDISARILWERWAANQARDEGCEAIAQGHDLARVAYEDLFIRKF